MSRHRRLSSLFQVTLEGKIVQQGQKKVERSKGDCKFLLLNSEFLDVTSFFFYSQSSLFSHCAALSGSVELSLPIRDISPSGNILVLMISDSGTVAADTTTTQVTPCLKHAVSVFQTGFDLGL